ncbi:MAG: hypothetical protein LUG51_14250 [Tannerellaceae bacterium]|nr:hypothetical protein [Tannerellaceae bacterium]
MNNLDNIQNTTNEHWNDKVQVGKDKARYEADKTKVDSENWADDVKEKSEHAVNKVKEKGEEMADTVKEKFHETKDRIDEKM